MLQNQRRRVKGQIEYALDLPFDKIRRATRKLRWGKMNSFMLRLAAFFLLTATVIVPFGVAQQNWPPYGGSPGNNPSSSLTQINRSNVRQLTVAWRFDTQEVGGLQTTPIIVKGVLYGITPTEKIFALDAATGKLLWKFDSGILGTQPDRGLAYWSSSEDSEISKEVKKRDARILVGVMNFLYALDAATGKPIPNFG